MKRFISLLIVLIATVLQIAAQEQRNYVFTHSESVGNTAFTYNYYNTGYKPKANTTIKLHFRFHATDSEQRYLCGADSEGKTGLIAIWTYEGYLKARFGSSGNAGGDNIKLEDGADYIVTFNQKQFIVDKDYEKTNHDYVIAVGSGQFTEGGEFTVGSIKNANGAYATSCASMSVYRCQLYEDGKLVRDYYPVWKDSKYKLYDPINNLYCDGGNSAVGHIASSCPDHKYSEIVEVDGKIKAYCTHCRTKFDVDMWTQTEDLGMTLTDPYLDVQADACDAGSEKAYVSCSNQIVEGWLINESTNELYGYYDFSDSPSSAVELTLPQTEKNTKLAFVAKMLVQKTGDSGAYNDVEHGRDILCH